MNKTVGKLLLTGLGSGYLPGAPGTWGSAVVAVLFVLLAWTSDGSDVVLTGSMGGVLVVSSLLCIKLGPLAEEAFGKKDPGRCVIDEWAGQAMTLMFLPMPGEPRVRWAVALIGFIAFRLFDVMKLPPAKQAEKLPQGWGVLLDDLAAAVYANILCQFAVRALL